MINLKSSSWIGLFSALTLSACLPQGPVSGSGAGGTTVTSTPTTETHDFVDWNSENDSPAVCDGLGNPIDGASDRGLFAELRYIPDSAAYAAARAQAQADGVVPWRQDPRHLLTNVDYRQTGTLAQGVNLFFNQVYVPNRKFNQGFVTTGGETLVGSDGNAVYEFFQLKFSTKIKLPEGEYQFAVLSDDGSIFKIKDQGASLDTIISMDEQTEMKMGCASRTVQFGSSSQYDAELEYYQGPRDQLGVVLLYREVPANLNGNDRADFLSHALCGQADNWNFFDPDNHSAQGAWWNQLVADGWKTVPASAFTLPESVNPNPCKMTPGFPISGRACYTETWGSTVRDQYTLQKSNVDPQTLRVYINDVRKTQFGWDGAHSLVSFTEGSLSAASTVRIEYCEKRSGCVGAGCDEIGI